MRLLLLSALLLLVSLQGYAQPAKERVDALRISFITKELDLSPEEAQQFWPVYNEFREKLEQIRQERDASVPKGPQAMNNLSDNQIEKAMEKMFALEQQELDLKRSYHERFLAILPVRKVGRLHMAEQRFKLLLLNELKKRRERNGGRLLDR